MGTYVRSIAGVIALAGACVMYTAGAVSCAEVEKAHSTMLLLTQTDNDRTAEVHIGGSVRINLAENATTGFRWAIDRYDEQLFEVVATEPHYPKDSIGAGGDVSFTFRAKKPWRDRAEKLAPLGRRLVGHQPLSRKATNRPLTGLAPALPPHCPLPVDFGQSLAAYFHPVVRLAVPMVD